METTGLVLSFLATSILITALPRSYRDWFHREDGKVQKVKAGLLIAVVILTIVSAIPLLRLFLLTNGTKIELLDTLTFYANRIGFLSLAIIIRFLYTNRREV